MRTPNELIARDLSAMTGTTERTAFNWLSGKVRPSKMAQQRLDELGIEIRFDQPVNKPRRPKRRSRRR